MILFGQMLLFFILMLFGYVAAKKGVLDDTTAKNLSWIVVNISNPALVLSGCTGEIVARSSLLTTALLAAGLFLALIFLAELLIPLFFREREKQGTYKVMFAFSNMGFMGVPLISAVYGTEAVVYAGIFLIAFNLLIYTYGIVAISGRVGEQVHIRQIFNSGLCAGILSVLLSASGIPLSGLPARLVDMLANTTAPLSMMIIGASFVHISLKSILHNREILIFSAWKLLLLPVAGMWLLNHWLEDPILLGICFVVMAAPAGNMAVILSKQYGGNESTAVEGVAVTTLLSVLTMPLVFGIFS